MELTIRQLTRKYQATLPAEVRAVLGLRHGDAMAFVIEDGKILRRQATSLDWEFAKALEDTLEKWLSPNDEAAYRDL